MITPYVDAISQALNGVWDRFTLPVALCVGLLILAGTFLIAFPRNTSRFSPLALRCYANIALGKAMVGVLLVTGWAALRTVLPLTRQAIHQRETAEATVNPVPDAPPVNQFGPALAILAERTYAHTVTLPPDVFQRLGSEGDTLLAPYLTESSADNILSLMDMFTHDERGMVFTRQVSRIDEEPVPFISSHIRVKFRRLSGRAYDAEFEGHYVFQNVGAKPSTVRFLFPLPNGNTIRDLSVIVGGQVIAEANASGSYEWQNPMQPGERKEAMIRYRILGANAWHYDLGSQRRRVKQFELDVSGGVSVRFLRGSLQPTRMGQGEFHWQLANVVTAQQVALAFLPDTLRQDCYLQALSALPVALALFLVGMGIVGRHCPTRAWARSLAAGLVIFALGLGAVPILANYLGFSASVVIAPLAGSLALVPVLGRQSLRASLPTALLPATFLSPEHSGLLLLLLAISALACLLPMVSARGETNT